MKKKIISVLLILVLFVGSGVLMFGQQNLYYIKDNPNFDGHMLWYQASNWRIVSDEYAKWYGGEYPRKVVLYSGDGTYWAVVEYKKPNPRNDRAFVKISLPSGTVSKWTPMEVKENIDGGIDLLIEDIDEYIYKENGDKWKSYFKLVLSYN